MAKEIIETFCKMVRISSESGEEKEFILYLKDLFEKSFKAKCIIDNYGNLIIKIPSKNTNCKESVLFGFHADTVKPGKNIKPILKDGIIFSKGDTVLGADDKAGIAEMFEAIRTADKYPPLEVIITRQEEISFPLPGSKVLDTSLIESKNGFVVDMDRLQDVVIGGPSRMCIKVKIIGKAAHAGMSPEKGISSIRVAAYAISMLKEGWIDRETTVNVGIIKGGQILNSVPEETNIQIECRSQSHKKCLYQSNLIKEIFSIAAKALGAKAKIIMNLSLKASKISENSKVVQIAKRAISSVNLKPKVKVICGGTDASNYNEKGITTVVIGTGVQAEHTKEEHIAVADMEKAIKVIHYIFKELSEER